VRAGAKLSGQNERTPLEGAVSQNSAVRSRQSYGRTSTDPCLDIASDDENAEVDVLLGELVTGRTCSTAPDQNLEQQFHQNGRAPTGVRAPVFPRKEVIQPQLPLRLPCYDFTPVTNPTFDGSLPCGLGHRLRVLPASVV
jgi:hypothetical protein